MFQLMVRPSRSDVWATTRIAPPNGRMARVDALAERNTTVVTTSQVLFILRPSASNGSVMEAGPNPA